MPTFWGKKSYVATSLKNSGIYLWYFKNLLQYVRVLLSQDSTTS